MSESSDGVMNSTFSVPACWAFASVVKSEVAVSAMAIMTEAVRLWDFILSFLD